MSGFLVNPKIRFVVVGGTVALIRGRMRTTEDVDWVVVISICVYAVE